MCDFDFKLQYIAAFMYKLHYIEVVLGNLSQPIWKMNRSHGIELSHKEKKSQCVLIATDASRRSGPKAQPLYAPLWTGPI